MSNIEPIQQSVSAAFVLQGKELVSSEAERFKWSENLKKSIQILRRRFSSVDLMNIILNVFIAFKTVYNEKVVAI